MYCKKKMAEAFLPRIDWKKLLTPYFKEELRFTLKISVLNWSSLGVSVTDYDRVPPKIN